MLEMAHLRQSSSATTDKVYEIQELITTARKTDANCGKEKKSDQQLPEWIDPTSILAGRDFVRRHFFLIFFTHFISLILLLSYIPVRNVLLLTKRSHTKPLALKRYLSTLMHVKLWYEGDLITPEGSAVRDILKVRKIHTGVSWRLKDQSCTNALRQPEIQSLIDNSEATSSRILKSIRKITDDNNNDTTVSKENQTRLHPISQLDMMVTQYCFMGLLTTFPEKFGVSSCAEDAKGLSGFTHMWAVIGYLLGIEDQFNLCLGEKNHLKKFILRDILLSDMTSSMAETGVLWEALVSAMSEFVPCLSCYAALLYILDHTLNYSNSYILYNDTNLYEKFGYNLMIFLLTNGFIKSKVLRIVFNNLLRLAIFLTNVRFFGIKFVISST